MTYKQLKEKLSSNDYEDLLEDLELELQMFGDQFKSIEELVKYPHIDLARIMCEDFPERYEI